MMARQTKKQPWRDTLNDFAYHVSRKNWQPYEHLVYVCDKIINGLNGGRWIINMPPQHGKSQLISHWLPVWFMEAFPELWVLISSYEANLATHWGRMVRDTFTQSKELRTKPRPDVKAANRWYTPQGGGLVTAGIGGPLTGYSGNLMVIDDPYKNWQQAQSITYRKFVIEWFRSTFYTRAHETATMIVIQCMTGDTSVLMADASEKPLRDIVPGDEVATYSNGKLETSRINNWTNHGPDLVFTIKMISGIIVKANARHPFLVNREGILEWIRLRDLKLGESILRVGEVNGKALSARPMNVTNQLVPKGSVNPTITNGIGQMVAEEKEALMQTERPISNIDMESPLLSIKPCSKSKAVSVPSAVSRQHHRTLVPTGMESSVSIISTEPRRSEGCCATTAICVSGTVKQKQSCSPQFSTYEIVPDTIIEIIESGYEDVFDIEVDRTENFIANGLVSHNTRWHQHDLAGWLMSEHSDDWKVISLPAIAEENDPLKREPGAPLCEYRYSKKALLKRKQAVGSRVWTGMFQQRPSPAEGTIFKDSWIRYWEEMPTDFDQIIQSWDMSFKDTKKSSYVVGQIWGRRGADFFLLGQTRDRLEFVAALRAVVALSATWPEVRAKLVEDKANGPAIISALKSQIPGFIPIEPKGGKEARAQAVSPLWESGNVYLPHPNLYPWVNDFIDEVMNFPSAANDDQVDSMTQALAYLDNKRAAGTVDVKIPDLTQESTWSILS